MAILRKTLSAPGGGDSVTFGETQDVRSLPGVRAEAAGACVGRGTYGVWIELSEGRRWNWETLACDNGSDGPAARCSGGVGCVDKAKWTPKARAPRGAPFNWRHERLVPVNVYPRVEDLVHVRPSGCWEPQTTRRNCVGPVHAKGHYENLWEAALKLRPSARTCAEAHPCLHTLPEPSRPPRLLLVACYSHEQSADAMRPSPGSRGNGSPVYAAERPSGCQVGVHADVLRQYHYVHSIRSTFASQRICR
jgi:hypothetical protein